MLYQDSFSDNQIPSAEKSFISYDLTNGSTLALDWYLSEVNPVATQTFFLGNPLEATIIVPDAASGAAGASFYLTNMLDAVFTGGDFGYLAPTDILVKDVLGNTLGIISVAQTVLVVLGEATQDNPQNYYFIPCTYPTQVIQNMQQFVSGVNGLGITPTGYICQKQNILEIVLSDDNVPYQIPQLNGNDLVLVAGSTCSVNTPTIVLPVNQFTNNQTGRMISIKNLSAVHIFVTTIPDGDIPYYIDRNITTDNGLAGNTSEGLATNGAISLGFAGITPIGDEVAGVYAVLSSTELLVGQTSVFELDLDTIPPQYVIDNIVAFNADVIQFNGGLPNTIYNIQINVKQPKLYFFVFNGNETATVIIRGINPFSTEEILLNNGSAVNTGYIDLNGNLYITNITNSNIQAAPLRSINYEAGSGVVDKYISANVLIQSLTAISKTKIAWSYPQYLEKVLFPNLKTLSYQGQLQSLYTQSAPMDVPLLGQWWQVGNATGAGKLWYKTKAAGVQSINIVPSDIIYATSAGADVRFSIYNPARFPRLSLTPITSQSYTLAPTDIGSQLNIGYSNPAQMFNLVLPKPSIITSGGTIPNVPTGATLLDTKTVIKFTMPNAAQNYQGGWILTTLAADGVTILIQQVFQTDVILTTDGTTWFYEPTTRTNSSLTNGIPTITSAVTLTNAAMGCLFNVVAGILITLDNQSTAVTSKEPLIFMSTGKFSVRLPTGVTLPVSAGVRFYWYNNAWFYNFMNRIAT